MPDTDQQLLEGELQTEAIREELESEEQADLASEQEQEDAEAQESEEIGYANQLALAQEQNQQLETKQLYEEERSLVGPSIFKYSLILLLFAIPNDVIDVIDFTGIGMILSWLISAFLSLTTLFLMWFTDSELKRVRNHMANRSKYSQALTRTMTKVATKLTKFAPKNPLAKIIAGTVLEMIPIISILPWSTISVFLAYADERKTYKEAVTGLEDTSQTSEISPEMV